MSVSRYEHDTIRGYLLGRLTGADREEFERRFFTDDELFRELQAAEDDLIDDFLTGDLSEEDVAMFNQNFLPGPERKQKLRIVKAYRKYAASHAGEVPQKKIKPVLASRWHQLFSFSPLRIAAVAAVVLLAAAGVWRIYFFQSEVDKGLLALNSAYRDQRPIESRITALNYAPFVTTRGPGSTNVNESELRRAELTLHTETIEKPTPAAHHALGKVYLSQKKFDEAIREFEEALKGDANNAWTYADLGAAYLEKGKLGVEKGKSRDANTEAGKGFETLGWSLENLNKAIELDSNLLEALFNRALCHQNMTLYTKAEEDWRKYLEKDFSSPWAEEARRNLKSLEIRRARTVESEQQLRQQFLHAFDFKNDDQAWNALSRTQRRAGNLIVEELLDDYLRLTIRGQSDDARRVLQLIVFAGDVQIERVGERYASDLAKIYSEAGTQRCQGLAAARNQMKQAIASFSKNEFDDAIHQFTLAERAFTKIADVPEALFARSWVGYSLLRVSNAETGIQIFQELLNKFEERGYKFFRALAWTALGDAHSSLNEFSKTLDYANRGLEASEQVDDTANALRCLSQRVSIHLILNNADKSLDSFVRATALADHIPPDPRLLWPLYYEAALNFHFLKLPSSALAFGNEAMSLANAADVALLRSRSWERLGTIHGEQGNFAAAIDSGGRALLEAQQIAGELSRKNVSAHATLILGELNAKAGDAAKAIKYFDESIALYADLKLEAYSYRAHKGKLLGLIALHDDAAAQSELETVIQLFESQRKKIVEESNRDKFFDRGQHTYDVAIDFAISRKNDYEKAFEYAEASRARSLFEMMGSGIYPIRGRDGRDLALRGETVPLTAYEIRKDMPVNSQLLEYAVLNDSVVIWVVTPAAINGAQVLLDTKDLEQSVRRFVSLLSGVNKQSDASEQILVEGKKLRETLIGPIEKWLDPKSQLCIVPDKSLNYLPFAALLTSSGKYFIEDFQLQQAPSAGIFIRSSAAAEKKARSTHEALLSVGNPDFNKSQFSMLSDLPAAETEANEIASFYKPATVLTGSAASRDRVIRGSTNADVIHFATHAVADTKSPLASKLILASDDDADAGSVEAGGALEAFDIYGLQLSRARLVVLSACQTGIERSYQGEGAVGLARPFIAAGVPLVIATLWPVESNATADLMIRFHRYRKLKQLPTVSALRMAQLDIIQQRQPNSGSDYGWAALTAIGGYAVY